MFRLFHEGWKQIDKYFCLFPNFYSFIYILFENAILICYYIRRFQCWLIPSSGSKGDTSHVFAAPFGVFLCCLCPSINGDSSGHSVEEKIYFDGNARYNINYNRSPAPAKGINLPASPESVVAFIFIVTRFGAGEEPISPFRAVLTMLDTYSLILLNSLVQHWVQHPHLLAKYALNGFSTKKRTNIMSLDYIDNIKRILIIMVRNIALPTAYQNNRSESFQLNLASLGCLKCVRHTLSIKVAKKSPPFSYSLPMSSLDTRRKLPGIL